MTEVSYPFVGGETTDAEFSAMFQNLIMSGVVEGLEPRGTSEGMQVTLSGGAGFVRGHYYVNTADLVLSVDSSNSLPRIDSVVLHLEYGSTNSIVAKIVKGTPGQNPSPPSLEQTDTGVYQELLGDIAVGANVSTITAEKVVAKSRAAVPPMAGGIVLTAGKGTESRPQNPVSGKNIHFRW